MSKITVWGLCLITWGAATVAVAGPSLIISEVFYDAPGTDSQEEWVELFNPTTSAIDVKDFVLQDSPSGSFTISTITRLVQPGETLVIARDATGFFNLYGFNPDISGLTLNLANGGDFVRLRDNSGVLLDEVAWEGALPGWESTFAATDMSLKRESTGSGPGAWQSDQTANPNNPNGLGVIPEPATVVLLGLGLLVSSLVGKIGNRDSTGVP